MDMGMLNSRAGVETRVAASRLNEVNVVTAAKAAVEADQARKNDTITEPDREQVLAAVTEIQDYVEAAGRNIQFQLDDDSGRMIVKVTERGSGDVIRQMPSEEALRLAENLAEMGSVLFSDEA